MKTVMYAEGGINWCWFTKVEHHDDGTVTILRHFRLHRYDFRSDGQPWPKECDEATWNSGRFEEDKNRTVTAYIINGINHKVNNPQYIFSYN